MTGEDILKIVGDIVGERERALRDEIKQLRDQLDMHSRWITVLKNAQRTTQARRLVAEAECDDDD